MENGRDVIVLAGLLATTGCVSPPLEPPTDPQPAIEQVLGAYSTALAISEIVGPNPRICVATGAGTELCEWPLGKRDRGWEPLADAIATSDRINLLCELPPAPSPREPESCTVHPRRSNRYSWKGVQGEQQAVAAAALDAARTLPDMSRLMGAAPESCVGAAEGLRCLWRTDDQTFGHGTLAVWIGAPLSKKVRLRCIFPADGSPRRVEACAAEIGD